MGEWDYGSEEGWRGGVGLGPGSHVLRVKMQWPKLCHTRVSLVGLKVSPSGQSWNPALGQRSCSTGISEGKYKHRNT